MKKPLSIAAVCRTIFAVVILLLGSQPLPVSAMDIPYFSGNDIFYYDGAKGNTCSTVGPSYSTRLDIPTLAGSDNAEKVWNFLKQQGLTDEQAAGVMGNIEQESGYNPDLEENTTRAEKGYGIVQWTFGRRTDLESAANDKGVPVSDLGFQLAYMVQESKSRQVSSNASNVGLGTIGDNEWDTLKKMTTIEDATVFWHNNFEVSADSAEKVLSVRGGYSKKAYEKYTGKSASGGSSSGASCSAAGSGDLVATLLEYAHPEFHENNYNGPVPPPKQAYLDVATKLTNEGKWVGGGMAEIGIPGIDCGGFVSILLTQSGFEPDYNYGLDLSRGASNQNGAGDRSGGQLGWAKRHWSYLGRGGSISTGDLRPGDVAFSNGHTFIFVGQVDGFSSQYASASYSWWRAPMAAGSWDGGFESATNPDYVWYGRREGKPAAYGSTNRDDPIPEGNNYDPTAAWNGG